MCPVISHKKVCVMGCIFPYFIYHRRCGSHLRGNYVLVLYTTLVTASVKLLHYLDWINPTMYRRKVCVWHKIKRHTVFDQIQDAYWCSSRNPHHDINITLYIHTAQLWLQANISVTLTILGGYGRLASQLWTRVSHVLEHKSGTWVKRDQHGTVQ